MRLNLGCGGRRLEGYVNIDADPGCKPDLLVDSVSVLPYGDHEADEIRMDSVFEHLHKWEQIPALREWRRVLRPGGVLAINWVPDFRETARLFLDRARPGVVSGEFDLREAARYTHGGVYQRDSYRGTLELHKDIFTEESLAAVLAAGGFPDAAVERVAYGSEPYAVNLCARVVKTETRQTVCLGMICRNEAHVIRECLDSVVNHIDYWVINDNGSTDGTQEIIQSYFAERGIPGELIGAPWKNFGFNRTEVFRAAKGKADYVLVIDADDILQAPGPWPLLEADSYQLRLSGGTMVYYRKQLFKNTLDWRYVGVLHEYADAPGEGATARLDGFAIVSRRLGDRNRCAPGEKEERDIRTLLKGLADEPGNARYQFYLAQTYRDARRWREAADAYEARSAMGGFAEEVFYSLYQKAECVSRIPGYPGAFGEILSAAVRAYEARPSRAEALYTLARYCRCTGRYLLGYTFGALGASIPYPAQDVLFIDSHVYDYALADETGVCATWVGRHAEASAYYRRALAGKAVPEADRIRILANLEKWGVKETK